MIDNAVDLANLSVGLGLYQLDALDMQANINKSIILITREMSESKMFESIDEDGKNLIISTLTDDFYFWADHNADITVKIITGRDIKKEIAEHSIKERQLWDEKLNGTYENGLRYFIRHYNSLDTIKNGIFDLGLNANNWCILLAGMVILFISSVMRSRALVLRDWISDRIFVVRYALYWGAMIMIIFSMDITGKEFIYFQF